MKYLDSNQQIEVLELDELSAEENQLILKAQEISKNSYSPYSNFHVGAAVKLENGEFLQSSNQENVSFPTGVCAERLVLGYSGANFPDLAPKMMAVVAQRDGEDTWAGVSPCGICRQTINEVENRFGKEISMLFLQPDSKVYRVKGISALLPLKFDDLKG